ncbi:catalase family peroxidase [Sphingomonas sp. CFBP8993]|uniref:catalase family peroxidase n=1 Tax=unclassified Sphingomonas TaxID=196159 RepID=UPI0027888093|nr:MULTISPECIES: catalase family peroxidase [unclassified Sphingomonas]MDQ1228579.1 catalase [Sphingomonas sp. SORGH_AS_0879]MDY0957791.1 catalase family peroxidase [Sphingomonas sp. CFBP8993]
MADRHSLKRAWLPLASIAAIAGSLVAAFAWSAGLVGNRITTATFLADTPKPFPAGYRRAHGKGICFDGVFHASGAAASISTSRVFSQAQARAIGRFSIGTADPYAPDNSTRTVSMAMLITADDGEQWRMKMNNEPLFATHDAKGFLARIAAFAPDPATGQPDPTKVAAFYRDYPEARRVIEAKAKAPWPSSFAGAQYHAIHAYFFIGPDGRRQPVRWRWRPHAPFTGWSVEERAKADPDHLFKDIAERLTHGPLRWDLVLQLAEPGDPVDDPSQPWPATRRQIVGGTLEVTRVVDQAKGLCRDINFDPTLVPKGIALTNDPVLATRGGIYAHSYNARLREIGYGRATDAVGRGAGR